MAEGGPRANRIRPPNKTMVNTPATSPDWSCSCRKTMETTTHAARHVVAQRRLGQDVGRVALRGESPEREEPVNTAEYVNHTIVQGRQPTRRCGSTHPPRPSGDQPHTDPYHHVADNGQHCIVAWTRWARLNRVVSRLRSPHSACVGPALRPVLGRPKRRRRRWSQKRIAAADAGAAHSCSSSERRFQLKSCVKSLVSPHDSNRYAATLRGDPRTVVGPSVARATSRTFSRPSLRRQWAHSGSRGLPLSGSDA